ncbi:MAG: phosphoglucosamine mutase [Elusimicrobiota bacterium]
MSIFGTDGVRGIPGREPLTDDCVRRLGFTAASAFLERSVRPAGAGTPFALLGRDTRRSGPRLSRLLSEGFARAGCRSVDIGVAPTPAVSYLARERGAAFGAVVSASHNPPEFNGIKFFTPEGFKAPIALEERIEARLARTPELPGRLRVRPDGRDAEGLRDYLDFLRSTFPAGLSLEGRTIVVDAANGAASPVAAELFRSLGAEVRAFGCRPDGDNINVGCGALETGRMQREVVRRRADCGVSLDGDADRAVLADERGRLLDGDALIAMSAQHLQEQGLLLGGSVVVTVMSNFGLLRWLDARGIGAVQVPVGDRNVTDAIEKGGYALGGENSGHVVFRRLAPTGDGLLTALQTLAVWAESGRPMSAFRSLYRPYPQLLRNVRIARRVPLEELPAFGRSLARAQKALAGRGRVFVRYSGTEPLLRILVEGPDAAALKRLAHGLERDFQNEAARRISKCP